MKSRVTRLWITSPGGDRRTHELRSTRTTIGRATPDGTPDVPLDPDPQRLVSRLHCVIEYADGVWSVSDNASDNGTLLRRAGETTRVFGRTELQHADSVLVLGDINEDGHPSYWKLKFDDPFRTQAAPTTAILPAADRPAHLEYDWVQMLVFRVDGVQRVEVTGLSPQGHKLIRYMAHLSGLNNGSPVACSHGDLIRMMWGPSEEWPAGRAYDETNLRNVVNAVRKRVELDPAHPVLLQTERNIGYRLLVRSAGTGERPAEDS